MDSSKNCCPFVTKLCAVTKLGDLTVWGNILCLAHAGILHSFILEGISGIFQRFTLWKKERVLAIRERTHVLMSTVLLSYAPRPQLPCMRVQYMKYYPLFWKIAVLGMEITPCSIVHNSMPDSSEEECKIQAKDKMFRHQQGSFSFPDMQFSRAELHFD